MRAGKQSRRHLPPVFPRLRLLARLSRRNLRGRGRVALATVGCEVGPVFSTARRAAEWVRGLYPDVTLTLDREGAQLASDERDERELRLIWRTSLINEKLLTDGASQRAAVIETLVR